VDTGLRDLRDLRDGGPRWAPTDSGTTAFAPGEKRAPSGDARADGAVSRVAGRRPGIRRFRAFATGAAVNSLA